MVRYLEDRYGSLRGMVRHWLGHAERASGRLRPFQRIDFGRVHRVVFVCRGNICRSCYADILARSSGVAVISAGMATSSGRGAHPPAIEAAARRGIDMTAHRTTRLQDVALGPGDLLVAMEPRQAHQLRAMGLAGNAQITLLGLWARRPRPHIHDPYATRGGYFDRCFALIEEAVEGLVARLVAAGAGRSAPAAEQTPERTDGGERRVGQEG